MLSEIFTTAFILAGLIGVQAQSCMSKDVARFHPVAVSKSGTFSVHSITLVHVGGAPRTAYDVLSVSTNGVSDERLEDFSLRNGTLVARPVERTTATYWTPVITSFSADEGASPLMTEVGNTIPTGNATDGELQANFNALLRRGFKGYCAMENEGGFPLLGVKGQDSWNPGTWSLCPNATANGRQDVVFNSNKGGPHYASSECRPIDIWMIPATNSSF
ncbi:hypothetical protein HGRIS_001895 [Hohenbuehelia grisea]|uniref:Uncharacterized protein n=1 Tax=Hohenbuehelia grisea TaxID=104357 RepID=A0ABR3JIS6_9AGAR